MQFSISALFTGYICVYVRVFVYIAGLGREQMEIEFVKKMEKIGK